ncbi:hypothetical protein BRARA_C03471 [Brassica rapa]|uniref:EDRF1 N-terminal domain-containing protein n=1 Tax=Brassica campestris TaxID=3711 RepID=A0A398A332_BRACM|nr:hypothetical protein BRARA_C03471 [Brassica rapa]
MSSSAYFPERVGSIKIASESIGDSVPVFNGGSRERVSALKFRFLPMETDLNPPPSESNFTSSASNDSHAFEEVVVSGLLGNDIDLIAHVDVLKNLFATPYTNAALSLLVQRIGDTLVLKPTPGADETHQNLDESLFQNFATQSLRTPSCRCPPTYDAFQSSSSERVKPGGLFSCHFDNLQMLVVSEQHLFRNGKDVDVSLNLLDVSKEVTLLPWIKAWLHNALTNVPGLWFCYHENGIVKGYEFFLTPDIRASSDGTLSFRQDVVQQNARDVLTFLRAKCKDDPGNYWLYRRPDEDLMHIFHLSKTHTSGEEDNGGPKLPSNMRSDSMFSLGNLLYMLALSVVKDKPMKCATYLTKCLNILVLPEHMVVRANAHELFARLFLENDKEDINSEFEDNVQGEVKSTFSDNNNYTCCYVAAPSQQQVHKPTIVIVSKYLAVYNVRKAAASLMWTQLLPASEVVDSKLQNLILLQREAQLALGQAYHEDKHLWEAFYSVRRACSIYASTPASMELPVAGIFRAKSWMLVGDLFFLSFQNPKGVLDLKSSKSGVLRNIKIKFSGGSTEVSTEEAVPGILHYLRPTISVGVRKNLFDAKECYEECRKALEKLPGGGKYMPSLYERKGRVCNEIGDLLSKERKFDEAQISYDDAILAYNKVPEHKGLVRQLNCKLGDLENARAKQWEESFYYKKAVSAYRKSLEYYKKAKAEEHGGVAPEEKVRIYKDLADTYLSYGILLAKEETIDADPEQPAGAAIREALTIYESTVLSKTSAQETANAYLELAQYMKRCCMRFLATDKKKALIYASIAEVNWRKSMSFYEAETIPDTFLSTLVDWSSFSLALPNPEPDKALSILLEGRLISETAAAASKEFWESICPGVYSAFWARMQKILLQMAKEAQKSEDDGYKKKLKGLYLSSISYKDLGDLRNIYAAWRS